MEKFPSLSEVACPLHQACPIQAVHMKEAADKQFLCMQCAVELKDFSIMSKVKIITELISMVSKIYLERKESFTVCQRPAEYLDLLSGQAGVIEQLKNNIEEEKRKTSAFFDAIVQEVTNIIMEKKKQCHKELDDQVDKLCSHFAHFERQLKKAYPAEEDLPSMFPGEKVLEKRFQSLKDLNNLKAFIKDLKEDLGEAELHGVNNICRIYQDGLKQLYKQVSKVKEKKPHYSQNDQLLIEFHNILRKDTTKFFEKVELKDSIDDRLGYWTESKIVTEQEFYKIKKWLPENQPFNPTLIYSSSRDGPDPVSFHKCCDGKKNTITLYKVIFDGSDKPCTLGGFLDNPWHSKEGYIESQKAFIFSITSNIKCPVVASSSGYAVYIEKDHGPSFGRGCDLCTHNQVQGYLNPYSYVGTAQLVQSNQYPGEGKIKFQTVEVEVYTLD